MTEKYKNFSTTQLLTKSRIFYPTNILDLIYSILTLTSLTGLLFLGFYFYEARFFPTISAIQLIFLLGILALMVGTLAAFTFGFMLLAAHTLRCSPLYDQISDKLKPISLNGILLFKQSIFYYAILTIFLYFYPSEKALLFELGIMLLYFLGCNFFYYKKMGIFNLEKCKKLSFNFFFISFLIYLIARLLVSFMTLNHEQTWFFPTVQSLVLICIINMSIDKRIFGKNTVFSAILFLSFIFTLGIFGYITHNLLIHLDIRKEHVNVSLEKEECIAAASLLGCNKLIIPKGGYCVLPNITVPIALGTKHRVNLPIKEFAHLIHCKIQTQKKITSSMILAYEVDENHVRYGQVINEIKN